MPSHTKKVGSAGRFGARYGLRIRKKIWEIEQLQKQKHKCPECFKSSLKRVAMGIWSCSNCGNKFAGGAYVPDLGKTIVTVEVK
jgi:large subunit ribosomal protein L37Ae